MALLLCVYQVCTAACVSQSCYYMIFVITTKVPKLAFFLPYQLQEYKETQRWCTSV